MKLLNCLACQDIVRLLVEEERACRCGRSSGSYLPGGARARYRGPARLLGMRSLDLHVAQPGRHYPWFVLPQGERVVKEDVPGTD